MENGKCFLRQAIHFTILILLIVFASGCVGQNSGQGQLPATVQNESTQDYSEEATPLTVTDVRMPTWISGEYNAVYLEGFISGGTYPYKCGLAKGSTLPQGLTLDAGSCAISGAILLAPGSTKSISPPFQLNITDSSGPVQSVALTLSVTTLENGPKLEPLFGIAGNVGTDASAVKLATASGGTPPYTFYLGSMAYPPPMGTTVGIDGYLKGIPTQEGSYSVYVCVDDSIGATSCSYADVTIYAKGVVPEKTEQLDSGSTDMYVLTVVTRGAGTLMSDDRKIECGENCSAKYSGIIYLKTKAGLGNFLARLDGCDYVDTVGIENEARCGVSMDKPRFVTAQFYPNPSIAPDSFSCQFLQAQQGGTEVVYTSSISGKAHADIDGTCLNLGVSATSGDETPILDCGEWTKEKTDYNTEICIKKPGQPSDIRWTSNRNLYWTKAYFGKGEVITSVLISKGACTKPPVWLYDTFIEYKTIENCPLPP